MNTEVAPVLVPVLSKKDESIANAHTVSQEPIQLLHADQLVRILSILLKTPRDNFILQQYLFVRSMLSEIEWSHKWIFL